MNTYHPHCNQYRCYHDGGIHHTTATAPAVTTLTVQPYYLYAEYDPDGTKNVYLRCTPLSRQCETGIKIGC
jgi:hypothetical protein